MQTVEFLKPGFSVELDCLSFTSLWFLLLSQRLDELVNWPLLRAHCCEHMHMHGAILTDYGPWEMFEALT